MFTSGPPLHRYVITAIEPLSGRRKRAVRILLECFLVALLNACEQQTGLPKNPSRSNIALVFAFAWCKLSFNSQSYVDDLAHEGEMSDDNWLKSPEGSYQNERFASNYGSLLDETKSALRGHIRPKKGDRRGFEKKIKFKWLFSLGMKEAKLVVNKNAFQ